MPFLSDSDKSWFNTAWDKICLRLGIRRPLVRLGDVLAYQQAPQWDDYKISPLEATGSGLNAPSRQLILDSGTGSTGVWGAGFVNTREDDLVFDAQLPHTYAEGTDIKFHVHWTMVTATTGTVRWGLEYAVANASGSGADDFFLVTKAPAADTTRQRAGTTARIKFSGYHGLVTNQNIVVSGAGVAAYNGNYRITNSIDSSTEHWIEYTIAAGDEAETVDAGIAIEGRTITLEVTATLSTNSQYKHLITTLGTIPGVVGGVNRKVSHVLLCRFYRPTLGGHIAERIPVLSMDFHHLANSKGSDSEFTK